VVFEAAFGWAWLIELLQEYGFEAHMAHPLQCEATAAAWLKNDKADAATLAHLLRTDLPPEAWIALSAVCEQRAICVTGPNRCGCVDVAGPEVGIETADCWTEFDVRLLLPGVGQDTGNVATHGADA
jgi:hypothetical protein